MKKLPPHIEEAVKADLKAYVDSTPPPPGLEEARGRVLRRMHPERMQSGSWDLEELQRQMAHRLEQAAAERLADEVEKRKAAESKLEKLQDERRKWWLDLLKGTLVALIATAVIFAVKVIATSK